MTAPGRHLAHFNWATLIADPDSPKVREFVNAVDRVNALAERSDGFVWRSGDEAARGLEIGWPLFDDPRVIASFSVWRSPEALRDFVSRTVHGAFVRRRGSWFVPDGAPNYVLWWVPAGTTPDIRDARNRAESILARGPDPEAFDSGWLEARGAT